MKGFKCFGLLLVLSIIFGHLFVDVSDANALKYSINSIDIGRGVQEFRKFTNSSGESLFYTFDRSHQFAIGFDSSISIPSGFTFPHTWNFVGDYSLDSDFGPLCTLSRYSDGVGSATTSSATWFYNIYEDTTFNLNSLNPDDSPFDLSKPLTFSNNSFLTSSTIGNICILDDYAFTGWNEIPAPAYENYPRWDWSSLINIPLVNNRFSYENSKPYTYSFNKLYLSGNYKGSDGLVYTSDGLKMSDIFKVKVPSFSSLNLNFTLFDNAVNRLDYYGSPESVINNFTLGGSIYFDEDYTLKDSNCLNSSTCFKLFVRNFDFNERLSLSDFDNGGHNLPDGSTLYYPPNGTASEVECSVSQYHVSTGDSDNHVDFKCFYSPSSPLNSSTIDFRNITTQLLLGNDNWSGDFLSTTGDYIFKDFYVVTNDDWTPTDWEASDTGSGGNIFDSPGFGVPSDGGEVNWFDSLVNMFTFGFFNPFAPIFQMFSDNNSCASIPTIAGMIHSEETQVCPWFDSSIRNIVTPVLGLSSMMLVFGFAVRWLGSSSGNLFEDSKHEEVSNQGGRWGHFKKGG